jgi:ribosome-binding factor A
MSTSPRIVRVNEILKRELADLIERENPAEDSSVLVSVFEVRTAPNLRKATVCISVFGGDQNTPKKVLANLLKKRKAIQRQMSKHVVLKYTPVLEFKIDDRIESADNVLQIIREMEEDA